MNAHDTSHEMVVHSGEPMPMGPRTQEKSGWLASVRARSTPAKPDHWLQMKFGVIILLALSIWSVYVVIGRVCTPIIRGESSAGLGRGTGIGVLVGFVILFSLYIWSYLIMITTGPGFARDHLPRVPDPNPAPTSGHILPPSQDLPLTRRTTHDEMVDDPEGPDPSTLAPVTNLFAEAVQHATLDRESATTLTGRPSQDAGLTTKPGKGPKSGVTDWREVQRPIPRVEVGPRWCRFCHIIKPDRTHHCRHCGTCVMQFDHHCLWIGQCVGWANHKAFIIFNFWGMLYCVYMLTILAVVAARDSSVDGQVVGLLAVSALFGLFTLAMFPSHVHLILTGRSTVESYRGRDQIEHEDRTLQMEYGYLWHNQEKRKVKKRWKEEWGGTNVDERWKWGTAVQMWKQEMGEKWIGWFLPIGGPMGDGLSFRSNPRFGPNGEWLQRKDWPETLRA